MKSFNKYLFFISALYLSFGLTSCDPEIDDKIPLGDLPTNVDFTIVETGEINTYELSSATPAAFIHQWDLGSNGQTAVGETASVTYLKKGDYVVTYTAVTDGGHASVSKTITVEEDAPVVCDNIPFWKFLSNCTSRTWRLDADEGGLWVGPDPATTWWSSPAGIELDRPCAYDDEWTFTEDEQMIYDTKGDIWGEDYLGFDFECVPDMDLAADVAAWGAGTHGYQVEEVDGVNYLTVLGTGAFIGLPKAANGAEVTSPVSSVRYTIDRFEEQSTRYFVEMSVNFGPGYWRFRIVSDK